MWSGIISVFKILLVLGCAPLVAFGANFAAPADGPVPFRRDRIALNTVEIAELSTHLTDFAGEIAGSSAVQRQGIAKSLALALALDPANTKARDLIDSWTKGDLKRDGESDLPAIRKKLQTQVAWLSSPPAGPDSRQLARCLADVLTISSEKNEPDAESERPATPDLWNRWIPEIASYETPAALPSEPLPANPDPQSPTAIHLTNASVHLPLWKLTGENGPWIRTVGPLNLTASQTDDPVRSAEPFTLTFGAVIGAADLSKFTPLLFKIFENRSQPLPAGATVLLDSPQLQESLRSNKPQSIGAAAALLIHAAITGKKPEAILIGRLDHDGNYLPTTEFWEELTSVGAGNGKRLILPAGTEPYLESILAFENPKFFMNHEVLLAKNLDEIIALSDLEAGNPSQQASAKFQEIRLRMGNQPLGPYVANPFVRRRLTEISQSLPSHQSAKMLAIQGMGARPSVVIRKVLIIELQRALAPMKWLIERGKIGFVPKETGKITESFEICRDEVSRLAAYADKAERKMVDTAQGLIVTIRALERAVRARQPLVSVGGLSVAQDEAYTKLLEAYEQVQEAFKLPPEESPEAPD